MVKKEPVHQRSQGSTSPLCCIPVEEWSTFILAARSTEVAPAIHPCPAQLFSTPKAFTSAVSEQLLHGDEMLGLIKQLRQVKNSPAKKGALPALPIQFSMQPWGQQLWEAGRKERAAKELLAIGATNN